MAFTSGVEGEAVGWRPQARMAAERIIAAIRIGGRFIQYS
jgi:hypothetical protein